MTMKRARIAAQLLALFVAASACGRNSLFLAGHSDAGADAGAGAQDDAAPSLGVGQQPVGGQCASGLSPCGKPDDVRCYDLTRSQNHCGICGNACAAGIACQTGSCQQYRCKGALSFKTLVFKQPGSVGALGDFDGDGFLDLVRTPQVSGPLSLLYGAGDGTFPTEQAVVAPTLPDGDPMGIGWMPRWQAAAADVDGDGVLDLISIGADTSSVAVHRGTGNRTAPFAETTEYAATSSVLSGLLLADLDADARLDLVVGASEGLEYWRGQDGGRFAQQPTLASPDMDPYQPGVPCAFDWNGDGALDLVYSDFGYGGLGIPELGASARLYFRLGHGDGSFDAEVACALTWGVVGDLDHDRRPDLISASSTMGSRLLLGIDGCQASKLVPIADWTKQGGAVLADLNGDGNLDFVGDSHTKIIVKVGDGQGDFPQSLSLSAPTEGQWPLGVLLIGDVNRDSKLDIVFDRDGGWGVFLNTCK